MKKQILLLGFTMIVSTLYGQTIPVTGDPLSTYNVWGYDNTEETTPNNRHSYVIQRHQGLSLSAHSYYGGIRFYNQEGNTPWGYNGNMVMAITNNKIGIGTTNPTGSLDIVGDVYHKGAIYFTDLQATDPGSGTEYAIFSLDNSGNLKLKQYNPGVCWRDRVFFGKNGNLGIGTASPGSKMEINTGITQLKLQGDGGVYGYNINVNTTGGWARNLSFSSNGGVRAHIGALGSGNHLTHLYFDTNNESDPVGYQNPEMVITKLGNVGIGTTTPDAKLTVNGMTKCEEVKVKVVNGPDYVFEEDYELPTLKETRAYIQKNKHLPEIPSAKEMEANGVDLGEMNMKLLKKIEELTLHQIELMEKFETQQAEIAALRLKLDE